MTRHSTPLRIATGLLLASAALTPALAQEVQPQTDPAASTPPVTQPIEPPASTAPASNPAPAAPVSSEPVVNTRASGNEPADPQAAETPATPARTTTRPRPARSATRAPAPRAAATRSAPRAVRAEAPPAPAPEPVAVPEAAAPPLAAAPTPAPPIAAAPVAPAPVTDPAPIAEPRSEGSNFWPWLIPAALAVAALLFFARRRRRDVEEDHLVYDEPVAYHEPVAAPEPEVVHRQPVDHVVPVAAAAAAVAPASVGRPWLDLAMRPVRAGVGEDAARVEFELDVENTGSAPARDVQVSAWLLAGNAPQSSDMERALIERSEEPQLFETTLTPGDGRRIETSVALPRAGLHDAILPVVVAEARYLLPDGSEGRTSASFAVGVERGEEMVLFDVENPSGMHEGVSARLHGEPHRD